MNVLIPIQATDAGETLVRVEDLWFPDHGLVVQAENKIFRVSGGILAARSSVFKDMLSIPQPDNQPLIEGCPTVLLHDSGEDVQYFLKAIFDSSFFEPPPTKTTFPIISGVLRLSSKYDVPYLRRRALHHFSSGFPSSLSGLDLLSTTRTFESPDPFTALMLADSLNLTWALPLAMYDASTVHLDDILDGATFGDIRVQLTLPLQRACVRGRAALTTSQNHEILRFLRLTPTEGCRKQAVCQSRRLDVLEGIAQLTVVMPLTLVEVLWDTVRKLVCTACFKKMETTYRAAREKVWDDLPKIFCGFSTWEQLKAVKIADLE
ncbi:hypothetical protein B0H10DRAFT_1819191 [Mycena sp. CBHHK59/15]|nr:hypothetical protein B0H10DRAFT_1819191 [Mycena sp. CBHHK59/15]